MDETQSTAPSQETSSKSKTGPHVEVRITDLDIPNSVTQGPFTLYPKSTHNTMDGCRITALMDTESPRYYVKLEIATPDGGHPFTPLTGDREIEFKGFPDRNPGFKGFLVQTTWKDIPPTMSDRVRGWLREGRGGSSSGATGSTDPATS